MYSASQVIENLRLQPHPEGGWYRETWRSPAKSNGRAVGTAILFLLESNQRSHWHRVDAEELWIWQMGDPLRLMTAQQDAGPITTTLLGGTMSGGEQFQAIVPKDYWQAAEPIDGAAAGFTLVSCVVTPGFEFSGFALAAPGWSPG